MSDTTRLEELEIKIAYLESQHHELNDVVVQLQEENRQLIQAVRELKEHMKSASPSLIAELKDETPPPHY